MGRGGTKIFLSRWGKEIRKGMIDHDTNVEEVAEKFGVSNTYINMMILLTLREVNSIYVHLQIKNEGGNRPSTLNHTMKFKL